MYIMLYAFGEYVYMFSHARNHDMEISLLIPGPEVIKLCFMLNSAEHDFFHANKSQITNNAKFFLA